MFDNLKNLTSLMSQAKEFRAKVEELQAELARKTVEGDAGAGAVRVTVNGRLEVVNVHLDAPLLSALASDASGETDRQMVQDLIAAATNAALVKGKELIQQEMSRVTGGLQIPGLPGLDPTQGT